jgi:hypothetical protein
MPERFQLPSVITSSSWLTVMQSLWSQSKRGTVADDAGIQVPAWTNREAVSVISAMRELAKGMPAGSAFPLWYQFAAVAYGWQPSSDKLDNSMAQADRVYPADDAVELNAELERIVTYLDLRVHPNPRMALRDVFNSDTFMSEVRTALAQDGAKVEFKIPLPACKDPMTGKPARPVKDPRTGKWTCPGGAITIDDPVTALLKALAIVAIPAALVLLAIGAVEPRRRRRKKR